jgi:transcriptional regulator with XRE-family HTH domain
MNTIEQVRPQNLGQRIRAARALAGISEVLLAQQCGITVGMLKGYGRSFAQPSPDIVDRIADACGVPRWWLHEGFDGEPFVPDRLIPRRRGDTILPVKRKVV